MHSRLANLAERVNKGLDLIARLGVGDSKDGMGILVDGVWDRHGLFGVRNPLASDAVANGMGRLADTHGLGVSRGPGRNRRHGSKGVVDEAVVLTSRSSRS